MSASKLVIVPAGSDFSSGTLGIAPTMWDPTQLSTDLLGWLDMSDASTVTVDGSGNVASFASKVGSYSFTFVAGGTKALYSSTAFGTGQPGATFYSGTNLTGSWYRKTSGPTNDAGIAIFASVKRLTQITGAAGDKRRVVAAFPGPLVNSVRQIAQLGFWDPSKDASQNILQAGQYNSTVANNSQVTSIALNDKGIISGEFTASAPYNAARINGATIGTSGAWADVAATGSNWNLGAGDNSNDTAAAFVLRELVVTKATITSTVRQKIEGYLAWRAGIVSALVVGHPYIADGPYA